MNYIQPAAINCTVMGAILERRIRADVPQMSGRDVVGNCRRRHCAALSLRTSQVHPAQSRRHDDLHGCGQAVGCGPAASRHQNLSLLLSHRQALPQGHHDRRSSPLYQAGQQRNGGPLSGSPGPWAHSTRVRETWHRRRFGMEAHHRCRELLSNQLTGDRHVAP